MIRKFGFFMSISVTKTNYMGTHAKKFTDLSSANVG